MTKERFGFIGLGIMGRPMCRNLIKAGYPITVYNRTEDKMKEMIALGAVAAHSPREVAENSSIIITMLPDSPDVEKVIGGVGGVLETAHRGSVIIDMSTISPIVTKRLAALAQEKGVDMLDAPVSGGEKGAIEATLAIMVGGKEEVFKRCSGIFHVLGKKVVHIGGIGCGGFAKLANQIIVGITLEAVSEALVLGKKAGLDPRVLIEAISTGAARCWALEVKANSMVKKDFEPGFKVHLHHKDLKIALDMGHDIGVPLPVTGLVHEMFGALKTAGLGNKDHSVIIDLIERLAGNHS